jgi:hypothetical protein
MAYFEYTPRSTLYHYTSSAGFEGIIRSKELWLSDLKNSNDPRELRIGYDNVFNILNASKNKASSNLSRHFIQYLENDLTSYFSNTTPYCLSLTHSGDSLPMWATYGAYYTGLSIGLRPTAIVDMPVRVQKVRYPNIIPDQETIGLINDLAEQAASHDTFLAKAEVVSGVFSIITSIKHDTWSYEAEVRLLHAQRNMPPEKHWHPAFSMTALLPDDQPVLWSEPLVRNSAAGEIKYLKFPFGRYRQGTFDASNAIEKVIIGPNCDLSPSAVDVLLRENGFVGYTVAISNCRIRM